MQHDWRGVTLLHIFWRLQQHMRLRLSPWLKPSRFPQIFTTAMGPGSVLLLLCPACLVWCQCSVHWRFFSTERALKTKVKRRTTSIMGIQNLVPGVWRLYYVSGRCGRAVGQKMQYISCCSTRLCCHQSCKRKVQQIILMQRYLNPIQSKFPVLFVYVIGLSIKRRGGGTLWPRNLDMALELISRYSAAAIVLWAKKEADWCLMARRLPWQKAFSLTLMSCRYIIHGSLARWRPKMRP